MAHGMSITARFLLGFTLVSSVGLYLLFTLVLQRVERQYMEAAEEPMVDVANILAEILATQASDGVLRADAIKAAMMGAHNRKLNARIWDRLKTAVDMDVYVTDASRRVLFDSAGIEKAGFISNRRDVVLTLNGEYGARSTLTNFKDPLSVVMYVGAPIVVDGKIAGAVSVAKPQRSLLAFIWATERWLKWLVTSVVTAMVFGVFLAARWATRPLDHLTQYALAISRGDRPRPPHMPGHQMKTLANALESMRDALEGREYVESYVQSLTHELKSPVAAILGASEILQDEVPEPKRSRFLQNIRSEACRLRDLIERLLHLAALEKQKTLRTIEPVDVREVLNRAWDHLALLAAAKQIELRQQDPGGALTLQGDSWLIELALSNLLQNAIDFAPANSAITVRSYCLDQRVVIEIEDSGPGVPDYAQHRVFERFYSLPRPDTGKKSTGLGLCFVKEVAQLHGGCIELLQGSGTSGTRAVLILKG